MLDRGTDAVGHWQSNRTNGTAWYHLTRCMQCMAECNNYILYVVWPRPMWQEQSFKTLFPLFGEGLGTRLITAMSWISSAYECYYAWPLLEANSTTVHDLTVLSVSSLPLSVMDWSVVAMHALTWVIFAPGLFHADAALWQVALRRLQAGWGLSPLLLHRRGITVDSEESIMSTCTEHLILKSFSTCTNLKCM